MPKFDKTAYLAHIKKNSTQDLEEILAKLEISNPADKRIIEIKKHLENRQAAHNIRNGKKPKKPKSKVEKPIPQEEIDYDNLETPQ